MQFEVAQQFASSRESVESALCDPEFYAALATLPKLAPPEVIRHNVDGDVVELDVRYRFNGHLSPAVTAVIDPKRLTWIDRVRYNRSSHDATFTIIPDHYGSKLEAGGSYRFEELPGGGSRRNARARVKVRVAFVGGKVEQAIVSGLREHLEAEASLIDDWIAENRTID